MNWLLALVLCILLVEFVLRLPLLASLTAITGTTARSMRVMRAHGVSDHWKERAMGAYAGRTFRASMTLLGLLGLVAVAAAVLVTGFGLISDSFDRFILSWTGLLASLAAGVVYVLARQKVTRG